MSLLLLAMSLPSSLGLRQRRAATVDQVDSGRGTLGWASSTFPSASASTSPSSCRSLFAFPSVLAAFTLSLSLSLLPLASAASPTYMQTGFAFHYDKSSSPQALSTPLTAQCEQITLQWGSMNFPKNHTGPSPVAPYFLQVYTSTTNTPFIVSAGNGPTFNWDVPFAPNTQYQICMFDAQGTSGGCQQTYTMIRNVTIASDGNATVLAQPSCANVTAPTLLPVTGSTPLGALGNFSYIDQCNVLSVTPQGGKPPYRLTIAPDFHPPFNISSDSGDAIKWKVALPVGFRFFVSLASADGSMWSTGPLRVGGLGPTDCLSPGSLTAGTVAKVAVGSSIGSAFLGALLAAVGYYAFLRIRDARRPPSRAFRGYSDESSRPLKAFSQGAPSMLGASTLSSIPLTTTHAPSTMSRLKDATPPSTSGHGGSEYTHLDYSEPATPPPPRALRPVRHRGSMAASSGVGSSNGDTMSTMSGGTANGPVQILTVPTTVNEFGHLETPSSTSGFTSTTMTGTTDTSLGTLRTVNPNEGSRGPANTATTPPSAATTYPPDIKRRVPAGPPPVSRSNFIFSDTASLASTASYSASAQAPRDQRRFSAVSRAPTYAPNPPRGGAVVYVIDEGAGLETGDGITPPDLPPEYGRHVEDSPSPPQRRWVSDGNGSGSNGGGSGTGSAASTPRRPARPLPELGHVRGDSGATDATGSRSLNRF